MDSSALVFLVCRAVEDRKKEEEKVKVEVRMERIEDSARALLSAALTWRLGGGGPPKTAPPPRFPSRGR